MLGPLFTIIAPILVCAGLGFVWGKRGPAYDEALITRLVMMIGAPCLVFSSFMKIDIPLTSLATIMLMAALATAIFGVIGAAALRLAGLEIRVFLPPLMFGNAGNMGLPLCLFAFGDAGLAIAIGYFAVASSLHYTLGAWLFSGHRLPSDGFKTPLPYAVALSALLVVLKVEPPAWILNTTELVGGLTIPLMLITLGVSLARLRVVQLPKSVLLGMFRIGMGLGVGVALSALFGLTGTLRGVVIIEASMPAAVFNYLLASHYARSPEEVASLVVTSTVVAFGALPFILLLVL